MSILNLTTNFILNTLEGNISAPRKNLNSQQSAMDWQWKGWPFKVFTIHSIKWCILLQTDSYKLYLELPTIYY